MDENGDTQNNVFFKSENIKLIVEGNDLQTGTLTINELCVEWRGHQVNAIRTWDYVDILMHAISRDDPPHVYCQLKGEIEDDLVEVFFYPETPSEVDDIFNALSKGAELNPDPPEEGMEDLEEGNFYYNFDEVNALNENDTEEEGKSD